MEAGCKGDLQRWLLPSEVEWFAHAMTRPSSGDRGSTTPLKKQPPCAQPCARLWMRLSMSQIRSRQRVADHGEVFTPPWMVEAMLDLVRGETERIDSRFLEPACGSGNFLVQVLRRKLAAVERRFGKSDFERRHYALLAVMCIYGIELLGDNIAECRANLLEILASFLKVEESDDLYGAASYVLSQNLVHGDALTMRTNDDQPITFAEWGYLGKGRFQRRDFRLDALTQMSALHEEGTLFAHLERHEVFMPIRTYPTLTASDLAPSVDFDAPEETR